MYRSCSNTACSRICGCMQLQAHFLKTVTGTQTFWDTVLVLGSVIHFLTLLCHVCLVPCAVFVCPVSVSFGVSRWYLYDVSLFTGFPSPQTSRPVANSLPLSLINISADGCLFLYFTIIYLYVHINSLSLYILLACSSTLQQCTLGVGLTKLYVYVTKLVLLFRKGRGLPEGVGE